MARSGARPHRAPRAGVTVSRTTGPPTLHISAHWRSSAKRILQNGWRKILVVGATDCGKSSYCNFLARALFRSGQKVAFVDADVGQKDVGPPGTISLAYADGESGFDRLDPAALYFVGSVSPAGHFVRMVIGTKRMMECAQAAFVITNTTGLVEGIGQFLKAYQVESVRPDVIVALQRGGELASVLRAHRHHNVIRLRSSPRATRKSDRIRREAREAAFRRYFRNARHLVLDVKRVVFQRIPLFTGEPIRDARFLYAEQTPDGVVAIAHRGSVESRRGLRILPAGFERGRLCGVADARDECLGLAIVQEIDFRRAALSLLTPVARRRIRVLQFGDLCLSAEGRELGCDGDLVR